MGTDAAASVPPGARVLEMAHGAALTHILAALARLEIADHLAAGPRSVADLARAAGAEPDLLDRLLRAATVLGLLEQTPAGTLTLTPAGACLRTGPGSLRDLVLMIAAPGQMRPLEYLTETISGGGPAAQAAFGQSIWDYYRQHPEEGTAFAGAMSGVSAMIAGQVAAVAPVTDGQHIVDVGGGHGTLLRALLATAPHARGVVLDLPEVISAAPAAERIQFTAGDFRTSVPAGGDVYILSHVLHDWDDDSARAILVSCRRAAGRNARLLIVEAVLAGQPGPLMPELLNLRLLVMSGGRERNRDQYRHLLDAAGWRLDEVTPLPSGQSLLTAACAPAAPASVTP
jgi:SAM-dependent methyltransferase